MKSKVKVKKSPNRALKDLEKLGKKFKGTDKVKVGLPKDSNAYPDGTSVIEVGATHEFGSPERGIPQRSFLRSTINDEQRSYKVLFKKLSKKILEGSISKDEAMKILGLTVRNDVTSRITEGIDPPLKSRKGTPLIDTGHLRQSITYDVE
jgi:phage gpG-like protein